MRAGPACEEMCLVKVVFLEGREDSSSHLHFDMNEVFFEQFEITLFGYEILLLIHPKYKVFGHPPGDHVFPLGWKCR